MDVEAERYLEIGLDVAGGAKYLDVALTKLRMVSSDIRRNESHVSDKVENFMTIRVLDRGYGSASSSYISEGAARRLAIAAKKQAKLNPSIAGLATVKQSKGSIAHTQERVLEPDEILVVLRDIYATLVGRLSGYVKRLEVELVQIENKRSIATSEGSRVEERTLVTVLIAQALTSSGVVISKKVGRVGGIEAIDDALINSLADSIIEEVRLMRTSGVFSPLHRGERFDVILDDEASGAIASAVADKMVPEGLDIRHLYSITTKTKLTLIDNPRIPTSPGVRVWDDEGVETKPKRLLSPGGYSLLHTRITTSNGEETGNAVGLPDAPKPSYTSVYFKPGDWGVNEIFEETKQAFYIRGFEKIELDPGTGILKLKPRASYIYVKDGRIALVKNLIIEDKLENILSRATAISKRALLYPEISGYMVKAFGGPFIRVSGARCT